MITDKPPKNKHAVAMGKLSRRQPPSEAQRAASRRNGLKGGRPKHMPTESNSVSQTTFTNRQIVVDKLSGLESRITKGK